jgi:hypothetical protein
MNAILLAGACAGAMMVFLTSDPLDVAAAKSDLAVGTGAMTHDIAMNAQTREIEETSVIAFND